MWGGGLPVHSVGRWAVITKCLPAHTVSDIWVGALVALKSQVLGVLSPRIYSLEASPECLQQLWYPGY